MINYLNIFVLAFGIGFCSAAHAATFVDGMDDIPMPENMSQITQDDISFGNEETRLLEAYLTVSAGKPKTDFNKIADFYKESLPQLGWIYQGNRGNDLLFYREGETLEVVKENHTPLMVRITVKTKP
jgi:hypothetical protein